MSKTAVVILNWNGRAMMEKYLPFLLDFTKDEAEIIVADNASDDDSLFFLRFHYPEIRTIELEKNWGFAEGYNKALKQVEADYYVLLNSDVEVTRHWLSPLVEFMDEHADVAACQPKLLAVDDKQRFEYAGASGGFLDCYGYPFCRGRVFFSMERDEGQYDNVADVLWASGACMLIRSSDYWAAGGLDGRFFAHNEEIDLCWRLRLRGRRVVCLPASHVYHVGGGTLPKGNPMKTYLNFRNNLTMLYKNLPERELTGVMRVRWWLDRLAAIQMLLLEGNLGECKAVFKARRDFKQWKRDFASDRELIQRNAVNKNIPQRCQFSLLWAYYVRRRKRFSQLGL